jgi:hypothetical protein
MPTLSDLLYKTNELPLHQAILSGDETQSLRIIRKYKTGTIENRGHLLQNCYWQDGKISNAKEDGLLSVTHVKGTRGAEVKFYPIDLIYPAISQSIYLAGIVDTTGCFYPNESFSFSDSKVYGFFLGVTENKYIVIDQTNRENIFQRSKENWQTAIHLATSAGMVNVVKALLAKGMPVNIIDGYGKAPMHYAAMAGHEELMQLLSSHGADYDLRDASKCSPLDVLKVGHPYSDETLACLTAPDPYNSTILKAEANQLHKVIMQGDLNSPMVIQTIQVLARSRDLLVRDPNGIIPSRMLKVRKRHASNTDALSLLVQYVEFRQELHSLLSLRVARGYIWQRDIHANQVDTDICHITTALQVLNLIIRYITPQSYDFNKVSLEDALNIFATSIFALSYDLHKSYCDIVPWSNLVHLRVFISKLDDNLPLCVQLAEFYLKDFALSGCLQLLQRDLLRVEEHLKANQRNNINKNTPDSIYKKNKEDQAPEYIPKYMALYKLTDPSIDYHSLKAIVTCSVKMQSFQHDTEEGRRGILQGVKTIGELCKFKPMSRRMSDAVKKGNNLSPTGISDIPWRTISSIRDDLAKYIQDNDLRSLRNNVKELISDGDDQLFIALKQAVNSLGTWASETEQFIALTVANQVSFEQYYENAVKVTMINEQMLTGLRSAIGKIQTEKLKPVRRDIKALEEQINSIKTRIQSNTAKKNGSLVPDALEATQQELRKKSEKKKQEISTQEQENTDILSQIPVVPGQTNIFVTSRQVMALDRVLANDPEKLKVWQNYRKNQVDNVGNNNYGGFLRLRDRLDQPCPLSPFPAHLLKRYLLDTTMKHIDKLGMMLLGNQARYDAVIMNPHLLKDGSTPEAEQMYLMSQKYAQEPQFCFACNQLIADIQQYFTCIKSLESVGNKKFRGLLEHQNSIYESLPFSISAASFLQTMEYIIYDRKEVQTEKANSHQQEYLRELKVQTPCLT